MRDKVCQNDSVLLYLCYFIKSLNSMKTLPIRLNATFLRQIWPSSWSSLSLFASLHPFQQLCRTTFGTVERNREDFRQKSRLEVVWVRVRFYGISRLANEGKLRKVWQERLHRAWQGQREGRITNEPALILQTVKKIYIKLISVRLKWHC